jgi:hypothetical protein
MVRGGAFNGSAFADDVFGRFSRSKRQQMNSSVLH